MFNSPTYRRATKLRNELLKERMNIADEIKYVQNKFILRKKDDLLKIKIAVIDKILQK